jgi:hypothetical protein
MQSQSSHQMMHHLLGISISQGIARLSNETGKHISSKLTSNNPQVKQTCSDEFSRAQRAIHENALDRHIKGNIAYQQYLPVTNKIWLQQVLSNLMTAPKNEQDRGRDPIPSAKLEDEVEHSKRWWSFKLRKDFEAGLSVFAQPSETIIRFRAPQTLSNSALAEIGSLKGMSSELIDC